MPESPECFGHEDVETRTSSVATTPCKSRRRKDWPSQESELWHLSSLAPDVWPRWSKSKLYNPLNVCRKLKAWKRMASTAAAEKEVSNRERRPRPSTHQMASSLASKSNDLGHIDYSIPTSVNMMYPSSLTTTSASVSSSTTSSRGNCASTSGNRQSVSESQETCNSKMHSACKFQESCNRKTHPASIRQESCNPRRRSSLPACDRRSKEARGRREDKKKVGTCARSSKTSGGKFGSLVSKCLNSHQVQKSGAADDQGQLQLLPLSSAVSHLVAKHLQWDPAQQRADSRCLVQDVRCSSPHDVCWCSLPAHVAANNAENWVTVFG